MRSMAWVVILCCIGLTSACGDDDERLVDARPPTPDAPVGGADASVDASIGDAAVSDASVSDAAVTDASPATFDLTFTGTGYNPHDGQTIWFALWDDANTSAAVATRTTATDGAGNLSETFSGALVEGHSYTLYWAADFNGNGACNSPPADHGWSVAISTVSGNVSETYNHDTNFDSSVCNSISP